MNDGDNNSILFDEVAATIALEELLSLDPDYAMRPFYSCSQDSSRPLLFHLCHLGSSLTLIRNTFRAHPGAIRVFLPEEECCTALYAACLAKIPCWEVIHFLLLVGDLSLLSATNVVGYTAATALLRNPGVSVEILQLLYEWDDMLFYRTTTSHGCNAIHLAIEHGASTRIIEFVADKIPETLEIGCDVLGYTPLHLALSSQPVRDDVIKVLAEKRPSVIAKRTQDGGLSPFCMACCPHVMVPFEVMDVLVANYPLQQMDWHGLVDMRPATIKAIFDALNYNCFVIELNLSKCTLSEHASVALFQCLAENDTLEIFRFHSSCVTWSDSVLDYIKQFFTENFTVRSVVFELGALHHFRPKMFEGLALNNGLETIEIVTEPSISREIWYFVAEIKKLCGSVNVRPKICSRTNGGHDPPASNKVWAGSTSFGNCQGTKRTLRMLKETI